ncbi:MAG: ubiquinone biosynthesis methyltransferase UbiE [Acidimicrobiaceae bacterium TMED77]|nr:ubiquinone/menaquinone biosynthesis methyltransferase [Acidimicrobiales bacterium]OUV00813.1 MAG: ubiquinone biosynthesis methyltransferase UbiE [Acidimicrobiaceae bacterium TMED77]|tara:strand:+ start:152 stop:844 length:693 start_codon:yes stop_codon:yes gene_type:complete
MDIESGLPTGEEKAKAVQDMFDQIAPRYDFVNRVMTFRLDVRWRKRTVAALELDAGSTVIDLACGTGDFCCELEDAGINTLGFDFSIGMLQASRSKSPLAQADILKLPIQDGVVDGATCGFALRNLTELPAFFEEVSRVLKPGGRIGFLDVAEPENRLLNWGHHFYFDRIVPKVGALLSDKSAYSYLPKSFAYLPPHQEILTMLENAGFSQVKRQLFAPGSVQLFSGKKT